MYKFAHVIAHNSRNESTVCIAALALRNGVYMTLRKLSYVAVCSRLKPWPGLQLHGMGRPCLSCSHVTHYYDSNCDPKATRVGPYCHGAKWGHRILGLYMGPVGRAVLWHRSCLTC